MAASSPSFSLIGQLLLLRPRTATIQPARARIGGYILRSAILATNASVGSPVRARARVSAAIEYPDEAGVGSIGSPSFAAPEGVEAAPVSTQEGVSSSSPAKGSVGVVEAMTGKTIEEMIDTGGMDGDVGKSGGGDGGGGGGGGGDDGQQGGGGGKKQIQALSMSQKLTLVYAALVGVGGLMGFLKSGSTKSLFSGGIAALTLLTVYSQLPVNPVSASSLGAGISLLLLFVMGSRFRSSGKFFPAGLVSVVSLIMSGGYVHGILRAKH